MSAANTTGVTTPGDPGETRPLSGREREILGHLAKGLSGAAIARELVLSPETVRTHVRNAMEKLGATTRSQAVAIALESGAIGDTDGTAPRTAHPAAQPAVEATTGPVLTALLAGVVALADIESGSIYLAAEGGMVLRLAARASGERKGEDLPRELSLGDPGIGKVALQRRAQLIAAPGGVEPAGQTPMLAAPMTAGGKLTGVLALGIRSSRPTSRRELLLIEAFANRLAEILAGGADSAALRQALQRFKASWTDTLSV